MRRTALCIVSAAAVTCVCSRVADAQHTGDVLVQLVAGQMVTGSIVAETNSFTMSGRVYSAVLQSNFRTTNPGFAALPEGSAFLPTGAAALPAHTALAWDFVPMLHNDVLSNLWYWDGVDDGGDGFNEDDVEWNLPVNLQAGVNPGSGLVSVNGASQVVPGAALITTESDGSIHGHPAWRIERVGSSDPLPQGIYMLAMQLRMEGVETSVPLVILLRSLGTPGSATTSAQMWAETSLEELFPPAGLPGDYNSDGTVDAADYTVWRDTLGSTTELAADGDGDNAIGPGDWDVWKQNFGRSEISALNLATVPEPATGIMFATLSCAVVAVTRRAVTLRR